MLINAKGWGLERHQASKERFYKLMNHNKQRFADE